MSLMPLTHAPEIGAIGLNSMPDCGASLVYRADVRLLSLLTAFGT